MSLLCETNPAALAERLRDASAATPSLIADVIRLACRRFPSQGQRARTERIEQLIRLGAWTDASLALIELELPQWGLRRLAYDGGEWYCALSRGRELPEWLDETVEGYHSDLALAILSAFVKVHCTNAPSSRTSVPATAGKESRFHQPLCCDNFS